MALRGSGSLGTASSEDLADAQVDGIGSVVRAINGPRTAPMPVPSRLDRSRSGPLPSSWRSSLLPP